MIWIREGTHWQLNYHQTWNPRVTLRCVKWVSEEISAFNLALTHVEPGLYGGVNASCTCTRVQTEHQSFYILHNIVRLESLSVVKQRLLHNPCYIYGNLFRFSSLLELSSPQNQEWAFWQPNLQNSIGFGCGWLFGNLKLGWPHYDEDSKVDDGLFSPVSHCPIAPE